MARPRNSIPNLKWDAQKNQFLVYVNRRRVWLGADRVDAERQRLAMASGECQVTPGSSMLVAEAFEIYHCWAKKHYADPRARNRIKAAVWWAIDVCGAMPADQFRAKALREVRGRMLGLGKLCRRYVNHMVTALKTGVGWLVAEEILPADALASVRSVRALEPGSAPDRPRIQPADDAQVARTLPLLHRTIAAMVRIQQLTGMRPGEVCRMRRCDVSTSATHKLECAGRQVSAVDVGGVLVWMYAPQRHKNSHRGLPRAVAIGPEAQKVLAPFLMATDADDYIFRPADAVRGLRGAKCLCPGQCYSVDAYNRAIRRAIERHNRKPKAELIEIWNARQLRKSAAEAADEAMGAGASGDMLGHGPSRRALDAYCRQAVQRTAAVAAKVG